MKKYKHLLLIAALCFIAVIAYLSYKEAGGKSMLLSQNLPPAGGAPDGSSSRTQLMDVHYTKMVKGVTEFEINAKSVEYFKNGITSELTDIHVKFFAPDGDEYNITGNKGTYDAKKGEIVLSGDVLLRSKSGIEFETDSIVYDHDSKIMTTNDPVKLKKEGIVFKGLGMELDIKKERINILRDVKARIAGL